MFRSSKLACLLDALTSAGVPDPLVRQTEGELRHKNLGVAERFLVLGGYGHSGSIADDPSLPTYANNDGWWDDTSDGPVGATIVLASGERIGMWLPGRKWPCLWGFKSQVYSRKSHLTPQ